MYILNDLLLCKLFYNLNIYKIFKEKMNNKNIKTKFKTFNLYCNSRRI